MATFLEIKTRVQTRLIDLPTAVSAEVPSLVNKAMLEIQKKHNFQVMKARSNYTTTIAVRILGAIPSDYKEFRSKPWYLTEDNGERKTIVPAKKIEDIEYFWTELDDGWPDVLVEGLPSNVANARNFEIYPLPDGNSDYNDGEYRIRVPYWKFLPDLVADGDINWFTVYAEDYLINMATAEGFAIDWDEDRMALWTQKAAVKEKEAIKHDKVQQLAGIDILVPHHRGAREHQLIR